jgi:hypothetical protein
MRKLPDSPAFTSALDRVLRAEMQVHSFCKSQYPSTWQPPRSFSGPLRCWTSTLFLLYEILLT